MFQDDQRFNNTRKITIATEYNITTIIKLLIYDILKIKSVMALKFYQVTSKQKENYMAHKWTSLGDQPANYNQDESEIRNHKNN